jgi:hypothetical protein
MINLPSVPDNTGKYLMLMGIAVIGLFAFSLNDNSEERKILAANVKSLEDSLKIQKIQQNYIQKRLIRISNVLSKKYNTNNPIRSRDSMIIFDQILIGDKAALYVNDSISKLWENYKETQLKTLMIDEKRQINVDSLDAYKKKNKDKLIGLIALYILGFIVLLWALTIFFPQDKIRKRLLESQLLKEEKYYRFCQSCGKIFSLLLKKSRNSDGTINNAFCVNCYDSGKFTEPELTLFHLGNRIKNVYRGVMNIPKRFILFTRITNLERWRKDDYFE